MGAQLGAGTFSDINMTPLIDIVLVVLIIMMVNIPIQVEEMGLNLPSKVETPPPEQPNPDQLVVALYEDGTQALNRRAMKEDELFYELGRRLPSMSNKIVFIDAAPTILYTRVVDAIDVSREAGAVKVVFAKMKPEGPLAALSASEGAIPRGVSHNSPAVVGEMTEKRAYEAFQPLHPSVESCYATALGTNPKLGGRLVVQADVGPQGEIMATAVQSETIGDPALADCVKSKLPALRFEPLGEGKTARINYSMFFSPG